MMIGVLYFLDRLGSRNNSNMDKHKELFRIGEI